MRHLFQDLKYAWRGLLRAPVFSFVALRRNRFGGDPQIVGRKITITNHTFTIIGVSQAGFDSRLRRC